MGGGAGMGRAVLDLRIEVKERVQSGSTLTSEVI